MLHELSGTSGVHLDSLYACCSVFVQGKVVVVVEMRLQGLIFGGQRGRQDTTTRVT
jgi:hypothetical protein